MSDPEIDRPVFKPKGLRPLRDEQWEMKQAVIVRDGVTSCFWCRRPFLSVDDATLEHILPLSDGGMHDLRNCTLACTECNGRNEPLRVVFERDKARAVREATAEANRFANGIMPFVNCDPEIQARFDAISRDCGRRGFTYAQASFYLKNIHRQLGRVPPTGPEKHAFKANFNRWRANNPKFREPPVKSEKDPLASFWFRDSEGRVTR